MNKVDISFFDLSFILIVHKGGIYIKGYFSLNWYFNHSKSSNVLFTFDSNSLHDTSHTNLFWENIPPIFSNFPFVIFIFNFFLSFSNWDKIHSCIGKYLILKIWQEYNSFNCSSLFVNAIVFLTVIKASFNFSFLKSSISIFNKFNGKSSIDTALRPIINAFKSSTL